MPRFEGWVRVATSSRDGFNGLFKHFGSKGFADIVSRPSYGTLWQIWLGEGSKSPFEKGKAESIEDAKYLIEDFFSGVE